MGKLKDRDETIKGGFTATVPCCGTMEQVCMTEETLNFNE